MNSPVLSNKTPDMAEFPLNGTETDYSHPIFSSTHFMMYCYKVMPCMKSYRHDWRVCPYAHVGETAARRHPKLYSYVGVICPETKKGEKCPRGDSCPCTHSLFEYWLHPTRFKTEFCSRGSSCSRSFCFFAHSDSEVRVFDASVLSSPLARRALSIAEGNDCKRVQASKPECTEAPQINNPFSSLDVGFSGQTIWSMRPCDLSRSSKMCSMASLGAAPSATSVPGRPPLPVATPTAPYANLWGNSGSLSHFGSGQSSPPSSDLDSIQRYKFSWPELSRQALNDYLTFDALTALYMLLPPSDN